MKLQFRYKGGEGSGFRGHTGRPGLIGGSSSSNISVLGLTGWSRGKGNLTVSRRFVSARNNVPIEKQGYLSHNLAEEITNSGNRVFVSNDGNNGFMLSSSGDIQNLFSLNHRGRESLLEAIRQGGKTLDCFDGFLPKYYAQFGFVEVGRDANWTPGDPDVVYMELKK